MEELPVVREIDLHEYNNIRREINKEIQSLKSANRELVEALKSLVSRATQSEENMSIYKNAQLILSKHSKEGK